VTDPQLSEEVPDKPASDGGLRGRIRGRLKLAGGALASIAAVGAVAGGLLSYWNAWKTLRTDLFQERQKTQREAAARPDIVRLSLVLLPFANLNNDPEQDYFANSTTTESRRNIC
jgi:adenylate cyclase